MIIDDSTTRAVVEGMSNEAYHSGPGLSHSDLKRLRKSPWHYHAMKLPRTVPPKAPSAEMFNGTLVHCALLEHDQFEKRYVSLPDDTNKRTNAFRDIERAAIAQGKLAVITEAQREAAYAQAGALRELPQVAELLAAGRAELSAFWRDLHTGVLCKCRPDWAAPVGYGKGAVLLDVKTTADASPDQFARSVANFEYHTQADWYCEGYAHAAGVEVHGMVFACVENTYPYAATAYMLDDDSLRLAHELNRAALNRYVECTRAKAWPGYPNTIQVIGLPRWALKEAYA